LRSSAGGHLAPSFVNLAKRRLEAAREESGNAMTNKQDETLTTLPPPDFEALSRNLAQFVEEAGKATAAYMKPLDERRPATKAADDVGEIVRTLGQVAESWLTDPAKAIQRKGGSAPPSSASGPRRSARCRASPRPPWPPPTRATTASRTRNGPTTRSSTY
jgi:hypothetical protein